MDDENHQEDENYSVESSDEEDKEEAKQGKGTDNLKSTEMDIPVAGDIPIVSKLGKKKNQEEEKKSKLEKMKENREKVSDIIQAADDDLVTHFVDNPFIKFNVNKKGMIGKSHLSEQFLTKD